MKKEEALLFALGVGATCAVFTCEQEFTGLFAIAASALLTFSAMSAPYKAPSAGSSSKKTKGGARKKR